MLKSYEELRKVDVRPYCKERDGFLYLNWAKCIDLLHENGAEKVYFIPVSTERGSSLIETESEFIDKYGVKNRCYETRIEIHIDECIYYMQSPVTNGANPVKDNSMNQQRVWNSMCRSFVKGVAIYTGLGFDLWIEEEEKQEKVMEKNTITTILDFKEALLTTITEIQKKSGMSLKEIAEKLGKTDLELKNYIGQYAILHAVQNNLECLLRRIS